MDTQVKNKFKEIIDKSIRIEDGTPARYHLYGDTTEIPTSKENVDQSEAYRKITFGERDKNKPHKTILLVGETGSGKTTLINTMVNYMLGVQKEDRVWFEITDDQSSRTSAHRQTSIITVYGVYLEDSPINLTIIDTPGYGDKHGIELDKYFNMSLLSLSKSVEGVLEIDAVCLVINSAQNRLSDRKKYIFGAVQSLFGKDFTKNIVLLLTHSTGARPVNALTAVKEANIKCAVDAKNQPVYFLFDNCQSDAADEEYETTQERSWNLSFKGVAGLFNFFDQVQPIHFQMTQDILQKLKQLETNMSNLQSQCKNITLKQKELKDAQLNLDKIKEYVKQKNYFEYEVEVPYKEKIDVDPNESKEVLCCTVCEENCQITEGRWPWWSSVIKNNHCTVCTNKCHYTKHIKEAKKYINKTKKEKRTHEDLKKQNDDKVINIESLVKKLEAELHEINIDKVKLVMEAFHCVKTLQLITRNTDSVITRLHIDFLIEKLKEINEPEKAETLQSIIHLYNE